MYTPYDIKNAAGKIYNEGSGMRSSEKKFKGALEESASWWQGNAGKSFVQGYLEAGYELNRLYSEINNLEKGLRRLASEVQRADDERRRLEAEKRLKEQMKNNKY